MLYSDCGIMQLSIIGKFSIASIWLIRRSAVKNKIGFSKDVERRIKQLDTRPFKINLIAKSKFISDAYDREQELHEYFVDQRVDGERYEFSDHEAQYAKEIIDELEEDC